MSVGPVFESGMGQLPVPHTEIQAWAANTCLRFDGAEAEWLHRMSAEYAGEMARSDGKNTAAPFVEE